MTPRYNHNYYYNFTTLYTLHYTLHYTNYTTVRYNTLQYTTITLQLPVVPHKAVAEVSKIGNL